MYIKDIFNEKKNVLSFEIFPPKKSSGIEAVTAAVDEMVKLPVDYISVTYGAGGSTSKKTADIAQYIMEEKNMTSLAHLTCLTSKREEIQKTLEDLKARKIENILALRGDKPADGSVPVREDYKYASELVEEIKNFGGFCVGGACYPECHPDCASLEADIDNLRRKTDAGCDFLVTQMFFDNDKFYRFRDMALKKGIDKPITAGIMPLTSASQIEKMVILSGGASMPSRFLKMYSKYSDNDAALKQAGIAYAVEQIIDLLSNDVGGIHIYTMNKPDVAEKIVSVINNLFI
ncbi:MAG: methylenetetrahydrofolate reductase [NAD(P)H] [Clostridiales bacterium]|nr:methylenetetrahydrofolate reductase [NAD(P)H] [Clostridiales bacterium]